MVSSISNGEHTEENCEIFKLSPTTASGNFPHFVGCHKKLNLPTNAFTKEIPITEKKKWSCISEERKKNIATSKTRTLTIQSTGPFANTA